MSDYHPNGWNLDELIRHLEEEHGWDLPEYPYQPLAHCWTEYDTGTCPHDDEEE